MKNKLYIASQRREESLKAAWAEVYGCPLSEKEVQSWLATKPGSLRFIGSNAEGEKIFWGVLEDIPVCVKAMADFLPLLGDTLANWVIVNHDKG